MERSAAGTTLITANAPLFTDDSMIRRVHREGVLLLGGGRALLMQLAHPSVAKGVAEHSSFAAGKTARLLRTLRPTLALVFGTPEQTLAAAGSINRLHEGVSGEGYRAADAELLLWVLATLIDSALVMHERFVRPLSATEEEAYYADMGRVGELLGVPRALLPADVAAFRSYVESMTRTLSVSDEARSIARELFRPALGIGLAMPALKPLTAGLLPPRLREQYGLDWGPRRQSALDLMTRGSRAVLPFVPRSLRAPPWFVMPKR